MKCRGSAEGLDGGLLGGMDVKQRDQAGHLKQGQHARVNVDEFHVSAGLADDAVAAGEFAETIAVDKVHASEVDKEPAASVAGVDVDEIAKLGVAVGDGEAANDVNHDDAIEFAGFDLKSHKRFGAFSAERVLRPWLQRNDIRGQAGFQARGAKCGRAPARHGVPGGMMKCGRFC